MTSVKYSSLNILFEWVIILQKKSFRDGQWEKDADDVQYLCDNPTYMTANNKLKTFKKKQVCLFDVFLYKICSCDITSDLVMKN